MGYKWSVSLSWEAIEEYWWIAKYKAQTGWTVRQPNGHSTTLYETLWLFTLQLLLTDLDLWIVVSQKGMYCCLLVFPVSTFTRIYCEIHNKGRELRSSGFLHSE